MQLWKPSYNDQNQNDHPHQHWGVHVAFPLKLFHIEAENSFVGLRKSQSYSETITILPPIHNHHLPHLLLQNAHVLVTELPLLSPKQFNSKVLDSCYMLLLICLFQKSGVLIVRPHLQQELRVVHLFDCFKSLKATFSSHLRIQKPNLTTSYGPIFVAKAD